MGKKNIKEVEKTPEEIRAEEQAVWLKRQQEEAVFQNEPIKSIFRVTVAVDIVADGTEDARGTVKGLNGEGAFIYGIKGVRRLAPLFKNNEEFKSIRKDAKQVK